MKVSVVITCWNGQNLLEKNLSKVLMAKEHANNKIEEILVVDDASTDGSVAFLSKDYPQIRVVEHKINLGYAAVCNTGIKEAKSDFVAVLNLDVAPAENFLEYALPNFKDEKVFAVTFNEGKFGPGKLIWKRGFLEIKKTEISQKTTVTAWPNGGSSIFRKKYWQELGGMDELFLPFYFEDIDLGIRASKKGYLCLWEPLAKIEHQHEATINPKSLGVSSRTINLLKERNHLLLTWKNLGNFSLFFNHFFNLFRRCFFSPGYLRVVFSALKKVVFK